VSETIRARARELGYGEVGFARFDRRYVYQSKRSHVRGDLPHAICLALEQDFTDTQTLPSLEAEAAHGDAHQRQGELARQLLAFIGSLGYRCQVWGPTWHAGPMIPLFVEAGLGQLGINGQLLSPHFGSRARLQVITTDARVTYDKPVDYGIHKFCDLCQVCSLRCPGRAITPEKVWFRGVEKNKLIFKRCRPVMTRYSGCGICVKVCPIQRYGMKPVMDHYVETGEVLGKGTANLEGYTLPDKGYFKPGGLPAFDRKFFDMPLGRAEDKLVDELEGALEDADVDGDGDKERLWVEFRQRLERTLERRSLPVDMGMDLGE
jgi:ferredoxin